MQKFFSFGKSQAGILVTLVVLIALGACYFYIYIPANEKTVQERRFRCLRKIDQSIRTKIETSEKEISGLVNEYDKYRDSDKAQLVKFRRTISAYRKNNFLLLLPERASQYFENNDHNDRNHHHQPALLSEDTSGNKFYLDVSSQITLLVKSPAGDTSSGRRRKPGGTVIGMQFAFDQFIKPLCIPGVFDSYAFFIDTVKIYERYHSGLTFHNPDSMLTVTGKIVTPGLRSLRIGETDFKVFSHPLYAYTANKWIITGLLKNENYQLEKNQLPLWLLLLLLTAAISMLLSLPWIKLFHMGNSDRLTSGDGVAAALMSMAFMSMLFFAFFKYRVDIKGDRLKYEVGKSQTAARYAKDSYSRNVLATKVTNAFLKEIDATNDLLGAFQKNYKLNVNNKIKDTSLYLLGKKKGPYDDLFKQEAHHLAISQVFFLDRHGSEKINFSVDSTNTPPGHYDERDYFKYAGAFHRGKYSFYLDQVYSYTTGDYKSVISQKITGDSVVAAVSFYPKSIDSVVMPDGYQFAIIDKTGKVLYHSVPSRDQVDRLQTEFADSSDLVSSMKAAADTSFKAEYYGKLYNVKIKPVPTLPYFTVIFEDLEYNDIRDTQAYLFTLSMLIVMLMFLGVTYCVIFFASSRHSFFKKQHFDTSWIGPHLSAHHEYNLATLNNLFIISMLVIFFVISSFLEYLYILLVSVVLVSYVLNKIFEKKYKNTDPYKYKFKRTAARWLVALMVVIDISACANLCFKCIAILALYHLIILGMRPVIYRWSGPVLMKFYALQNRCGISWTFTNGYALMATTRLIISSGIPAVFFFIYSFNYEQNLDTRYRQLNFAAALMNKYADTTATNTTALNGKLKNIQNNLAYTSGVYNDGLLVNDVRAEESSHWADTLKNIRAEWNGEDTLTASILSAFRLHTNYIEVADNDLNTAMAGDKAFFSKLNRQSGDHSPVQTFYRIDSLKYLRITSLGRINYRTPHWFFWFLLILAVFVFYLVVHAIIKKVFALTAHAGGRWATMDVELLKNHDFSKNLLIVGAPGSDTLEKLVYRIKKGKLRYSNKVPFVIYSQDVSKNNVFIADMMKIPAENDSSDARWKRHKNEALGGHHLVIIDHFEYNIADPGANKMKLDLLELLVEQTECKVIILSTVHPLVFLDSFAGAQKGAVSESERSRWHMLLGDFHVLIDTLVSSKIADNTPMPEKAIREETRYSRFLHRMQTIAIGSLKKQSASTMGDETSLARITDSLIFKLQLTGQYFYTDVWQSLTWEEKFLLYDLAEDGLVNSTDDITLTMLMCKGLIINDDGVPVLFNRGFRNFILTAIEKSEVTRIKQQLKDNGTWANLKTPFRLVILAILAFLFASQQEEYSRVITYITTLGAGIPAVMKVFSVFGGAGAQKTD